MNLVVWNWLIFGYMQNGPCEEAMEAFNRMQVERLEPDEVSSEYFINLHSIGIIGSRKGNSDHDCIERD